MIHLDRNRNEIDSEQNSNLILQEDHSATFNWVTDISHNDEHHNYFANSLSDLNNNHPEGQTIHPIQLQTDDKSSSLSPPPEYTSPPQIKQNSPQQDPVQEQEREDEGDGSYSRQLTPLTDLSAVPDGDDSFDFEKKDGSPGVVEQEQSGDLNSAQDNQDNRWPENRTINGTSSPVRSIPNSPTRHPIPIPVPAPSHRLGPSAGPSHSRRPSREIVSISQLPSPNLPQAKLSDPSSGDTKASRILEINSELLKVCMEFQTRGVPPTDARFSHFANRVQLNLTWLGAAADPNRCNDPRLMLPAMDAPSPVEFISMDRIHHLYADLPTIFAKELARRQLASSAQYSPTTSAALLNGPLKRNRPDDMADLMNKRRDIGETKSHSMQPPAIPSISISGAGQRTSPASAYPPSIHPNMPVASTPVMPQSPRTSSPMPPPLSTPSLPFGATEASIAATTRARAREVQINQAREQQLRAAQMQHQMQSAHQIPPPDSSPRMPQNLGPASLQHPHTSYAQNASAMQILQTPGHPLTTYLMSQIPNFTSLPLPQQVQKLTDFRNILAQKQQQNPSNQQQRPPMPGQMPGLTQNPSMSPMPNVPMQSNGPNPVSPLGQQSPVSSQPQQQMSAQPQQTGMYPFSNQGHNAPSVDPRIAASNFTQQMPSNMSAMNLNQQRQLMLMQQMRNSGGNMNTPNLMNPQQAFAMQQQQQQRGMPQGGPSQGGSPMSAPTNDTFPTLRSNSTIPGIARSGRSPSESVHSPMTPRAQSRLSSQPPMQGEDFQRPMTQQAQPGMMGMQQNAGSFHPQMQYHQHQWPNGQQQQQQQHQQQQQQQQLSLGGQMNGFGMNPQGGAVNSPYGGSISPSGGPNWQQQSMNGYYPQSNQRPPNVTMQQNISPIGDTSAGEYDIFNWNGP